MVGGGMGDDWLTQHVSRAPPGGKADSEEPSASHHLLPGRRQRARDAPERTGVCVCNVCVCGPTHTRTLQSTWPETWWPPISSPMRALRSKLATEPTSRSCGTPRPTGTFERQLGP